MSVATAGVLIGAAGTAYSAKQQSDAAKDARRAGKTDIGGDILSYIQGYEKGLPSVLGLERDYRDNFQNLNLNEIGGFLDRPGGLFDLSALSSREAGRQLDSARGRDLASLGHYTDETRSLLQSLNPSGYNQLGALNKEANRAREAAKGLTGQEKRSAEQFAREQGLESGRIGDASTIASGLLNRESILSAKRAEANAATQTAFGANQSFYAPGLSMLTQTPASYQAGQGLLGIGLGSLGSSTPQLVNPDAGINVGAANRQNQLAAASAASQASASQTNSWLNLLGSGLNSYAQYGAK